MSWGLERDDEGKPIRMVWLGIERRTMFPAATPGGTPVCPECGYCGSWHAVKCSRLNLSLRTAHSEST